MESQPPLPGPGRLDIFEIYRRFRDIKLRDANSDGREGSIQDDDSRRASLRESMVQLLQLVESRFQPRFSVFDELFKLMSQLQFTVDFSEFSCFYQFVFFMCRENGKRNISLSRAINAWRLVLNGRFRLLNQWCDFIETHHQYSISEDTWKQVLLFSRCVHENLEGYDLKGAWPVLVDEFVEHMYRISGSNMNAELLPSHDDAEIQSPSEISLPGLNSGAGLKRKLLPDAQYDNKKLRNPHSPNESKGK